MSEIAPPRVLESLLAWLLRRHPARASGILGDLREEYSVVVRRTPLWARVWYLLQALEIAARYGLGLRSGSTVDHTKRKTTSAMDRVIMYVRYALRRMWQSPGFTAVAILSLGLGIGANTAIFTIVNSVLLSEPPLREPERLVNIYSRSPDFPFQAFSYPDLVDLRESAGDVFEGISASGLAVAQLDRGDAVELMTVETVTGNYFELLGIGAHIGRVLQPDDDVSRGAHPVIVLSHDFWKSRMGADPDVVGSDIRVNGTVFTVVGVVQPEYQGQLVGIRVDAYGPMMMMDVFSPTSGTSRLDGREMHSLFVKGRLRAGVGLAEADAAVDRVVSDLRATYPGAWRSDNGMTLVPSEDVILYPPADRFLIPATGILMGVVGIVLLIACANLASFLLARAMKRRREIAVRLALGATRGNLVAQLLTETVLLGLVGGVVGLGVGVAALKLFFSLELPLPIPVSLDTSLDLTVLTFGLSVAAIAGLLFGIVPAVQSSRSDISGVLRDESAGGGSGSHSRLRGLLVIGQVALSLTLLVAAGLFVRSLAATASVDPGFGGRPAAMVSFIMPAGNYERADALALLDRLRGQVAGLPGVDAVGMIDDIHLNTLNQQSIAVLVDGVDPPPDRDAHSIDFARVTPGFFDAATVELIEGRDFDSRDSDSGGLTAIVNQAFVDRFWPGESGLGRMIRQPGKGEVRIVGVARTARIRSLGEAPRPFVYLPVPQSFSSFLTLVASTRGDAEALATRVSRQIREIDRDLIIWETKTVQRHIDLMLLPARLGLGLLGTFGALALILAVVGLYGIVSFSVAARTREVGIRISLGAGVGQVVRLLMGDGLRLVVIGGVLGIALAGLLSMAMSRFLFGVGALDPLTFAVVPLLFVVVTSFAAYLPARRASKVDPVVALKTQ